MDEHNFSLPSEKCQVQTQGSEHPLCIQIANIPLLALEQPEAFLVTIKCWQTMIHGHLSPTITLKRLVLKQ